MRTIIIVLAFMLMGAGSAQFEQKDIIGTTDQENPTVGTTAVAVPSVADKSIAEALIKCPGRQPGVKKCLVSFVGSGGPFLTLLEGEFIAWQIKGYIKQIFVKGDTASTDVEIILNYEP